MRNMGLIWMAKPSAEQGNSVTKRIRTSGASKRRPKSAQSVVTRVAPEAIERFAQALTRFLCAVSRPDDGKEVSEADRPSRYQRGSDYVIAIAEGRLDEASHGYPAGYPDWDQPFRLFWTGMLTGQGGGCIAFNCDRSLLLPDWMALPLIREIARNPELYKAFNQDSDESDETDSGKIDGA